MGRTFLEWSIYPLFVGGAITAGVFGIHHLQPQQYPVLVLWISLTAMALCFGLERIFPHYPDWLRSRGDELADFLSTNLILPGVSQALTFMFTTAAVHAGLTSGRLWGWTIVNVSDHLAVQLIASLLMAELGYYWMHRIAHKVPWFWRFHSVHHGAERVYWLNSGRFHPVDAMFSTGCYLLPLVFFEAPPEVTTLILVMNAVTGLLEHANIGFRAGLINRVFNSAELHRWHHSERMEICMSNYGKVLSIWDQIFGSFHHPSQPMRESVGLGPGTRVVPAKFWGQITYPWGS